MLPYYPDQLSGVVQDSPLVALNAVVQAWESETYPLLIRSRLCHDPLPPSLIYQSLTSLPFMYCLVLPILPSYAIRRWGSCLRTARTTNPLQESRCLHLPHFEPRTRTPEGKHA